MSEVQMPKNYKFLKGIVITLGILIVVMVIVLIVASIMKYNDQKRAEAALVEKYRNSAPQTAAVDKSFKTIKPFNVTLPLEDGQKILNTTASSNGLWVTIGENNQVEKIILIDESGNVVGNVAVTHP